MHCACHSFKFPKTGFLRVDIVYVGMSECIYGNKNISCPGHVMMIIKFNGHNLGFSSTQYINTVVITISFRQQIIYYVNML